MTEHCPHCDADISAVADAFCPECRKDLLEMPTQEGSGKVARPTRNVFGEAVNVWHMTKGLILLVALVMAAFFELLDGKPSVAIIIGVSVVGIIVAELLLRVFRRARQNEAVDELP